MASICFPPFLNIYFYFMCMVFCPPYVFVLLACRLPGGQERELEPLKLELESVVSHRGTRTQVL